MSKSASPQGQGILTLTAGFLLFGLAVGFVSGLSTAEGTGKALMAALFSFVAGALLGYIGFRKKDASESKTVEIDPCRVGFGLSALSLGVMIGVVAGISFRYNPPSFLFHDQVVISLDRALQMEDVTVAAAAARELARLDTTFAREVLAAALSGKNKIAQKAAAEVTGKMPKFKPGSIPQAPGLQFFEIDRCESVLKNVALDYYKGEQGLKAALGDLKELCTPPSAGDR